MKFLEAMKYQIVLQQFLLIAPFRVANNRVKSSVTHNVYIIFMTSCFLINIAIAAYIIRSGFDGSDKLRFGNGYLWGIIGIFELTFSNISFPILVIHTLINRCHQINFLNKICEIDETLNEKFGVDTNRLNDYQRWRSYFFIVWSNLYYWTLYYLTFVYVIPPDLYSKWGLMMILVANQMEQSSMGLLTWTIIYYCTIIRIRFVMLESINMVEILRSENVKRKRQLMATWLTVYQDLCRLIEKMNTGWGLVIATRYSHDFTLLISQMYLMYWIVEQGRQTYVFIFVLYWSIQNVLKLLGMGLSADMATREVLILNIVGEILFNIHIVYFFNIGVRMCCTGNEIELSRCRCSCETNGK